MPKALLRRRRGVVVSLALLAIAFGSSGCSRGTGIATLDSRKDQPGDGQAKFHAAVFEAIAGRSPQDARLALLADKAECTATQCRWVQRDRMTRLACYGVWAQDAPLRTIDRTYVVHLPGVKVMAPDDFSTQIINTDRTKEFPIRLCRRSAR